VGPGSLWRGGGKPGLFPKGRRPAPPEGSLAARPPLAQPTHAQSGKTEPANAAHRQIAGAENADPCRTLDLRVPARQPPIGLWPAPGLATIRALTQTPRGSAAVIFKGWTMAVPKRKT